MEVLKLLNILQLNVGDVGHIYKIRFHIDQTGKRPAWNMKKVHDIV